MRCILTAGSGSVQPGKRNSNAVKLILLLSSLFELFAFQLNDSCWLKCSVVMSQRCQCQGRFESEIFNFYQLLFDFPDIAQ